MVVRPRSNLCGRALSSIPHRATGATLPIGDGQMKTTDLDSAIEQSHAALGAILNGDPSVYQALYSNAEDVTLGNPFGPYARGRQRVEATLAGAASHYRDGEVTGVELIANYESHRGASCHRAPRLKRESTG